MPTTSNFGWTTPADTDLVKDGALAIRTLGNGIDTSMAELKGGTTGQVLSKTSNTDMDFTWVTTDDANAIQNAIVDAKGDLITATAADTPARLAVGNNGETLVADSSATTGLRWQGNFAAGKNKIINGDFGIWQRGTSFTTGSSGSYVYTADRWVTYFYGTNTSSISQQSFTAGTAPVAGYEGQYFLRFSSSNTQAFIAQRIEDVRTFAGQTITVSFWAKAASGTPSLGINSAQLFGSGGSASVVTSGTTQTLSTSWTRYSTTFAMPSISGKTIGSGNYVELALFTTTLNVNIDVWGVQVEAGNTATAFQTATGTLAGELAAAQRYYVRSTGDLAYSNHGFGFGTSTTNARIQFRLPSQMRVVPTSVDFANVAVFDGATVTAVTSLGLVANTSSYLLGNIDCGVASGLTQYRPYSLINNNNTGGYVGFSAEL